MAEFAEKYLGMNLDGDLSLKEGLVVGGLVLVLLLAVFLVIHRLAERSHIRKTSIFRVKKNKYKSRLGKKNIKY